MEVTQGTPAPQVPAAPAEGQVTTPAVETPAAVEKSAEFVKKAQQERELWQKQKAIKAREQEINAREARIKESEAKYQSYEQTRSQAKLNPLKYLQEAGLTAEDLVQYQLNNGSPTPDAMFQQLKAELEQTKQQLAEKEERQAKASQEQNHRAAQEAMESFKEETKAYVTSKPEDYELINKTETHNLVIETIEEHWNQGVERWEASGRDPKLKPKVLSKEEAAGLVEKFLEEKIDTVLSGKKYGSKYKRIEDALAEVAKDVQADSKFQKTVQGATSQVKPLHNGLVTSALPGPGKAMSMQEKLERAAALMKKSNS